MMTKGIIKAVKTNKISKFDKNVKIETQFEHFVALSN